MHLHSSNGETDILNQPRPQITNPLETKAVDIFGVGVTIRIWTRTNTRINSRQVHFQIQMRHQFGVSWYGAFERDAFVQRQTCRATAEGDFNGFGGEIGVPAKYGFEIGELRVVGEYYGFGSGAIGNKDNDSAWHWWIG